MSAHSITKRIMILVLILILSLSACKKAELEEPAIPEIATSNEIVGTTMYPKDEIVSELEEAIELETVDPGDIYPDSSSEESESPPSLDPLPSDPQKMNFLSLDSQELSGTFYPASKAPAPLIVLMHWALGDQDEFMAIAPWLQNRGAVYQPGSGEADWLDPSWFPVMPSDLSFNVFTFTFRNCENGCSTFDQETRERWAMDAQAAVEFASRQFGVNPTQIQTIGTSIGADGATIGCYQYNNLHGSGCTGALSLSPGGYLNLSYSDEVNSLGEANPMPQAWCLYGEEDGESASACLEAKGSHYSAYAFTGSAHGMNLLIQDMNPSALQVLFSFVNQ